MLLHALQQFELSLGTHKIVLRILDFIISITVDIICQEAYALHVWEQGSRIRQILNLYRQQEGFARFQIPLGKCLEYFHIEVHIIQILVVFQPRVGT